MTQTSEIEMDTRQVFHLVCALAVLGFLVPSSVRAENGDAEYGQFLSGECTTCHQESAGDDGIPVIVNWSEEDFILTMNAYKNKQRDHPIMQMIAGRLGDEEIAALAAYFANAGN